MKNKLIKTKNEHLFPSGGLVIPHEVADGITKASLIDMRNCLQNELDGHIKEGKYLHPQDVTKNHELIYCMNKLIEYYGGE